MLVDLIAEKNKEFEQTFEGLTQEEKEAHVKSSIKRFFAGKTLRNGGDIPEYILYSKKYINMCLEGTITEVVDKIHEAMGPISPEVVLRAQSSQTLLPSTERIVKALNSIARRGVPQKFSAGILFMYFKLCEGLRFE